MNGEAIFGMIVMTFCSFGCGLLFCGIAKFAATKPTPMGFWANGPEIKPEDISDIAAYNRENAKMWKTYSVPFWLCAVCALGSIWAESLMTVSIILLCLGCTVGGGWLVWKYSKIHQKYKIR